MSNKIYLLLQTIVNSISSIWDSVFSLITKEPTATIVTGVVVFVICEWAKETWLTPLQEYKKLKAKTSRLLIMYGRYYANPLPVKEKHAEYDQGSTEIREIAAELAAFAEIIPIVHLGIPKAKCIVDASKELIGISNGFYSNSDTFDVIKRNDEYRKKAICLLKLRGLS